MPRLSYNTSTAIEKPPRITVLPSSGIPGEADARQEVGGLLLRRGEGNQAGHAGDRVLRLHVLGQRHGVNS